LTAIRATSTVPNAAGNAAKTGSCRALEITHATSGRKRSSL
jgi:hypothetical protein